MSTNLIDQSAFDTVKLAASACPASSSPRPIPDLLRRACVLLEKLHQRAETWRATRQLLGADESQLKDIGIPRCGVEWAVRNGRDIRSAAAAAEASLL